MTRNSTGIAALIFFALSLAPNLHAYVASYGAGFHFLETPQDPRLIAMGTAGTAMPGNGFYYYNPAQLFLLNERHVSLGYGQDQADLDQKSGSVEIGWVIGDWYLAGAVPTYSISDIIATDLRGKYTGITFSYQLTMISLAVGYGKERFSAALCLNGVQERIANYRAYALSGSAGAVFWVIPKRLTVGAAGFHAGQSKGMLDNSDQWGDGAPLPRSARIGAAWHDSLFGMEYSTALDVVYRDDDERFMVPMGLELWPLSMLAVRAGKRFNHDTELFNFGLCLRLLPVSFDGSIVINNYSSDASLNWLVRGTYSLGPLRKKE